ncbi:Pc12g14400 [Penicillium rubens Wisconsin 54-1255]|uniref:Pc12g14400 protein n=1 Tax=Penicillium rubens (strain ATCC 28089 / DSM 1075 / NRRL 1951 / Wisconsin 54-1255) TaxID=500485 RepID=B6H0U9_PENRW|nr:Pc12g14400 [Penicillium rubens Wisconsin 54-1255]
MHFTKKAFQKCVEAKTACDLGKPKCKRCRDRGISCGYPAHAKSKSGATADNQYASVDVSPFSTVSDVISLDSTGPEGLVKSTGNWLVTPLPLKLDGPRAQAAERSHHPVSHLRVEILSQGPTQLICAAFCSFDATGENLSASLYLLFHPGSGVVGASGILRA